MNAGESSPVQSPPPEVSPIECTPPQPTAESEQGGGEKRKREEPEPETKPEPAVADSGESTAAVHPLWKTSLCSYFRSSNGECSHGETCRFAHSESELRLRPDKTWDPTSDRAKKLLKSENGEKKDSRRDSDEVLMTEAVSEDPSSESALDKCLVNLPMKWSSEQLRTFLSEQVKIRVDPVLNL